MAKKFTLGKQERLKSRKAIEQLFTKGRGLNVSPFRVVYTPVNKYELRFGVGVSSRHFKRAVDRNRVKRLVREAWRLQKNPLQEKLKLLNRGFHVFLTYTAQEVPVYKMVYDSIGQVVNKLVRNIDESNIPHT